MHLLWNAHHQRLPHGQQPARDQIVRRQAAGIHAILLRDGKNGFSRLHYMDVHAYHLLDQPMRDKDTI